MADFHFQTRFTNNAVIIIDGLRSTDLQTARRLYDELMDIDGYSSSQKTYFRIERVNSRSDLLLCLDNLAVLCDQGLRPIIHFECHGSKLAGLSIGDNQERFSWDECLSRLTNINMITGNNTGVVMATCYGFYAIMPMAIDNPCPFYFLIGSQDEVPAGVIDDQMKEFYKALYGTGDLDAAMSRLDDRFKQFLAEKFFAMTYGRYLKRKCSGKGLQERRERLISEALDEHKLPRTPQNIKAVRSHIKKMAQPSKASFDFFAQRFLHGRTDLNFYDIMKWVKSKNVR